MGSFSEAWPSIRTIDGWLTEEQARILHDAAGAVQPSETIVEIGSHHGRSTVALGTGKPPGVRIVAVDPYADARWGGGESALRIFEANIAAHRLDQDVSLLRLCGADAGRRWNGPEVGLLFVDGAHDYPSVRADLEAWLPHCSPTATVFMHDAYSSVGVTRAMFVTMFHSAEFRFCSASRSLVGFQRHAPTPSLLSDARMMMRLPWFARNIAIKGARRNGWRGVERLLRHVDIEYPY